MSKPICDECGEEFDQLNIHETNCEGVIRFFFLCDECLAEEELNA